MTKKNTKRAPGKVKKKAPVKRGQLTEGRDDIPHGHGAHVNEKESNAQEDYPGVQEVNGRPRE